jgi:PIN domain nuclease of toxin-antitoxin system
MMAYLNAEPGAEIVRAVLHDAVMSAVNFSEVLKKTIERKGSPETIAEFIRGLSVDVIPFGELHAAAAADLYPAAQPHGMSFADRACLSLGVLRRSPVFTAERKMKLVTLPIKVKLIRNEH